MDPKIIGSTKPFTGRDICGSRLFVEKPKKALYSAGAKHPWLFDMRSSICGLEGSLNRELADGRRPIFKSFCASLLCTVEIWPLGKSTMKCDQKRGNMERPVPPQSMFISCKAGKKVQTVPVSDHTARRPRTKVEGSVRSAGQRRKAVRKPGTKDSSVVHVMRRTGWAVRRDPNGPFAPT
ncbi:hypothetical protein BDY21DRAFT_406356 [Lineolata rhizophorae]|uniref:Uncharacterized protein n=1 Tax=Lineolata rhizophorae TaxID=578093 RepID=A0A6A6PAU7_9PEZI|nr:hypothetical protein BDY21DRAFT_406356 [Lineolata rhizophorae]